MLVAPSWPHHGPIRYKQSDGKNDMTSYYNYLIDGDFGLDILVYSGDDDDVCATIGTQSWIWNLGYEVCCGAYYTATLFATYSLFVGMFLVFHMKALHKHRYLFSFYILSPGIYVVNVVMSCTV